MRLRITEEVWLWLTRTLTGRLLGLATLILAVSVVVLGGAGLHAVRQGVLRSEEARLITAATALAVGLDGDLLLEREQHLAAPDALTDWAAQPALHAQQRQLAQFVEQLGAASHVYTLSLDPAAVAQIAAAPDQLHPGVMRFGLSSAARPYWHHAYDYRPEMAPTLLWGQQSSTRIYEDVHGVWMSAYAPVRTRDGQVVALVEVDAPLALLLGQARQQVQEGLLVLALMLAGLLATIGLVSRRVTRTVWRLVTAAERFGRGDLQTPIPEGGLLELAALGRALESARQDILAQSEQQRRNEAALVEALRVAREASAARGEFLATMSHELRTPMHGVLGATSLLVRTPLSDTQRELAGIIRESGQQMTALIDRVLDFSRLEGAQVSVQQASFQPAGLARARLEAVAAAAEARGLSCRLEVAPGLPEAVLGSPEWVEQVLGHLLENAVKFTEAGHIRLVVRADDVLRFEVHDTGIGIPVAQQHRIFEPFTQADGAMSRRYGGSGLGLSICQRLVQRLGGTLGVDSTPGAGSVFWFTLPLRALAEAPLDMAAARQHRQAEATEAPAVPHVLVAEDHPINQKIVVRLLEGMGCTCEVAEDGVQALELASQRSFSLVLMDCQMPHMDGLQAATAIRQLAPPWREVPIVALTANTMDGDRERCLAAGMDDYLRKPVSPEQLAEAVGCWSQRRSA